jgi:hypothetical protein
VDANGNVVESDETNNSSGTVTCGPFSSTSGVARRRSGAR